MVSVLIEKLASMILLVIVGYISVKTHVLKVEDSKPISSLAAWILTPCLIVNAFQIDVTPERMFGFVAAMILGFVSFLIWIVLTTLLRRPLHLSRVEQGSLIYPNVGNLVLPLVSMALGDEMVFYASSMQVAFNLTVWTHGNSLMSETPGIKWEKIVKNPNLIALVIGLVLLVTGLRPPDVVSTAISSLGSMMGPVSMLLVGIVIADRDLKEAFTDLGAYRVALGRLIILPSVILALLYLSGVIRRYPSLATIYQVTFIAICAPPASTISQMAVLYDQEPEKAGIYNVVGTLLCMVTIPVMLLIYQKVFGLN